MTTEIKNIKTPWTNKKTMIAAISTLVGGVLIFTISYVIATSNSSINQSILNFMLSIRQDDLTEYVSNLTILGSFSTIGILAISIAIIWASYKREFWRPILLLVSILITAIATLFFKSWCMVNRPSIEFMVRPFETDYALPSGHTISVFVLSIVIGYLICSRRSSLYRILGYTITAFTLAAMIAITRLYLGYHWLTDTTASVGLGLIILSLIIFIDKIVTKKFTNLQ